MSSLPKARVGLIAALSVAAVGGLAAGAIAVFGRDDKARPTVVAANIAVDTTVVETAAIPVASEPTAETVAPISTSFATLPPVASVEAAATSIPDISVPGVLPEPGTKPPLIIATDLPLQGASADNTNDTNLAIALLLEQAGYRAGNYDVALRLYDDSTKAVGGWDDATCAKNARDHVALADEVAVMGTYNSGCSKIQVPVLNQDVNGPMLMVSHANTNPGLTRAWDPGEPERYYPSPVRNYGRILATDDYQADAAAAFAAQELAVKRCVVLTDGDTFGFGMANAFAQAAPGQGIEIVAVQTWDPTQTSYTKLFQSLQILKPDCVYLGGINDNNGEQLVIDKVRVFGPNDGAVKLLAPDGFTGYPTLQALAEAQGMYITFSGLPISEMVRLGGPCVKFVEDFTARFGHEPFSAYALEGAAATQLIMKAIAASDGTRAGVRDAAFSGIVVPQAESVNCRDVGFDAQGEAISRDISIQLMNQNQESFLMSWPKGFQPG
jgi:branched-chain amino acid transport system substrate-binding protein